MKNLLLIMLALAVSICMMPVAFAGEHGDPADCADLEGEALELCISYCVDKACATDDPNGNPKSCDRIADNYFKVTGNEYLPCDIITCGVCADPVGMSTEGECDYRKLVDCVPPMQNYGANIDCEDVSLPAALVPNPYFKLVGCANMPGYIPDCQNGLPDFICGSAFLPGSYALPDGEECPALPSCFEE